MDLLLPSDRMATDIPHIETFLSDASGHFWTHLSQELTAVVTNTYLAGESHPILDSGKGALRKGFHTLHIEALRKS